MPAVPETFLREAGSGPGVLCLHSNAASSSQWRALMERLAPDFHVIATDGYGAGKGPAWPKDRHIGLADEVDLLGPAFERAGTPMALVGHSYGAAVALMAALAQPGRVAALVLYEPTLFSLLDAERPPPNAADGIRAAVASSVAALARGDATEAARCFIDYWMGDGIFMRMPEARRGPIELAVANAPHWAKALLGEPTPLAAFAAALRMPVLYLTGRESPPSSLCVARVLTGALPQAEVQSFEGLGHMGPVTHPEMVNEAIERFLRKTFTIRSG